MLRWHGGKFRLSSWIISHFPAHRIYVEPYAGAASVLLQKPRAYAEVLNDLDADIVNLFRVLRNNAQAALLIRALKLTPFARAEFEVAYLKTDDPVERARRLIIRSFMGFGTTVGSKWRTGFRDNAKRSGTVPAHGWAGYPDALEMAVNRLRGVIIEQLPALQVIRRQDSTETLFYCDPPYPLLTCGSRWAGNAY